MPAGKRTQSNATLYTLIIFVGLFILATTIAIIYYVKFEEQRDLADSAQAELSEMASRKEWQSIGNIVGTKQGRETYLGKMVEYLDEMVCLIVGGLPEDTSAEEKVKAANRKAQEALDIIADTYADIDNSVPNTNGLGRILKTLKSKLDNLSDAYSALNRQLEELHERFDDSVAASLEKEQVLLAEKEKYQQEVKDIQTSYDELKQLLEQTSEQRIGTLMSQLNRQRENSEQLNDELLKTQAQLKQTENRMQLALEELREIKPEQGADVAAYRTDGKIMLINDQAGIVHLNIGSDDRVYRGLTFSVYDKGMPIGVDGRGKAEIEVFDVSKNISMARIIRSEIKRPIITGDIIANLIWDSDRVNVFAVAGDFDVDDNGSIEKDGIKKLEGIIKKWGGKVTDSVSINTDFVLLGQRPKIQRKPTYEEIEMYPNAMEKYQQSLERRDHYNGVLDQAKALSIPVFNLERFLYFIGYKTQSTQAGAF